MYAYEMVMLLNRFFIKIVIVIRKNIVNPANG